MWIRTTASRPEHTFHPHGCLAGMQVSAQFWAFICYGTSSRKNISNNDIFKILHTVYFCNIKVSCSWSAVSQIKSMLFNKCPLDSKNNWKHLDLLPSVYVNCAHNIWRLIVWQWCTKPCKQYLSNNGQFPCEMDWKECDSLQKTILKWWPFNLMNSRNVSCSKALLKLETSIHKRCLDSSIHLCTHTHMYIILFVKSSITYL